MATRLRDDKLLRQFAASANKELNKAAQETKAEIDEVIKKLGTLYQRLNQSEEIKEMLTPAAKVLIKAAKGNIQDSKDVHHRYEYVRKKNRKGTWKAGKGKGKIVASYVPGNLKKSMGILSGIKKTRDLFIGPRINKRLGGNVFGKTNRVDGWYAHFQEYGTVNNPTPRNLGFLRKAYISQKGAVVLEIAKQVAIKVKEFETENKK